MDESRPPNPPATRRTRGGLFLAILASVVSWGIQHTEHGHEIWIKLIDPLHFFSITLKGFVSKTTKQLHVLGDPGALIRLAFGKTAEIPL